MEIAVIDGNVRRAAAENAGSGHRSLNNAVEDLRRRESETANPSAIIAVIAVERAIDDFRAGGAAADSAAENRVAGVNHTVADGGAGVADVNGAAITIGVIPGQVAMTDGRVAIVNEDPAAIVGGVVVGDAAVTDERIGVVAVDPTAIVGSSTGACGITVDSAVADGQ